MLMASSAVVHGSGGDALIDDADERTDPPATGDVLTGAPFAATPAMVPVARGLGAAAVAAGLPAVQLASASAAAATTVHSPRLRRIAPYPHQLKHRRTGGEP
jgi:hypothetical protein